MDIEVPQNPAAGGSKSSRKRKRRQIKKNEEKNGPQIKDSTDGSLEVSNDMGDCILVNNDLDKNICDTSLAGQAPAECPKMPAELAITIHVVNGGGETKLEQKKIKNKVEVQSMDKTKMDPESTKNLAEVSVSVSVKRKKKDEIRSMEQTDEVLNFHLSDGDHGGDINGKITENEFKAQVSEVSSLSGLGKNNENSSDLCTKEEAVFLPDVAEVSCSSELLEERSGDFLRPMEVEEKLVPCECLFKRKLIVLDVNGLLASIVYPAPKDYGGDTHILGRAVFKRPFCDDFLNFCFQNFEVGIWSSRSKKLVDIVVKYLLGDLQCKLLFCWDMEQSTKTGYYTLENLHKPLVCKELRKIWENDYPFLPWEKGHYNESNTLLLDDSPYKALLNPLHTAIFPSSYNHEDKSDNSLGPGGDLRVYLEGLLASENVQKYVEQHPFGQSAINETSSSWDFYSGILQAMSIKKKKHLIH